MLKTPSFSGLFIVCLSYGYQFLTRSSKSSGCHSYLWGCYPLGQASSKVSTHPTNTHIHRCITLSRLPSSSFWPRNIFIKRAKTTLFAVPAMLNTNKLKAQNHRERDIVFIRGNAKHRDGLLVTKKSWAAVVACENSWSWIVWVDWQFQKLPTCWQTAQRCFYNVKTSHGSPNHIATYLYIDI